MYSVNPNLLDFDDNSSVSSTSMSQPECYDDLDRILLFYENAAKEEQNYLLYSAIPVESFEIGCGISPARTFTPAVMLFQRTNPLHRITFGAFEWSTFVDLLRQLHYDFFESPLDQLVDEYESREFSCGDFVTITQMVYEDTMCLHIHKFGVGFYLSKLDVEELLRVNSKLIVHKMNMLEQIGLGFGPYYENLLELVRRWKDQTSNLTPIEMFNSFLEASHEIPLTTALREYLYYYEKHVITDLNK